MNGLYVVVGSLNINQSISFVNCVSGSLKQAIIYRLIKNFQNKPRRVAKAPSIERFIQPFTSLLKKFVPTYLSCQSETIICRQCYSLILATEDYICLYLVLPIYREPIEPFSNLTLHLNVSQEARNSRMAQTIVLYAQSITIARSP